MASSPLTLRNLTAKPIALRYIERFEDPSTQQSKAGAFSFSSRNTTSLAPAAPKLGEHAQTFNREEVDVKLLPFESHTVKAGKEETTDASSSAARTTTRLTIETPGGERYRIDTNPSYTQKASQLFTPLTPSPSTSLSALYHPANPTPHLTIHTNHLHDLSKWMSTLPSTLPLSAISIPGTHNSHTHYRALPSVRCQVVPVKTQLENGIRFLDIRVQPTHATDAGKKDLYLVHGAFPISLTGSKYLAPVLEACYAFLDQNPSETVIVSLKREGVGSSTDELLSEILDTHYIAPNREKWYLSDAIPYLSDVRGKLVLIRRYALHQPSSSSSSSSPSRLSFPPPTPSVPECGLDATNWPHNSTHALHGSFCVQDFCEVMVPSAIPQKLQYSNEHLDRAAECTAFVPGFNTDATNPVPAGPLYLNFLSGSNFWRAECWPAKVAAVVNRGVEEWICRELGLDKRGGDGDGDSESKSSDMILRNATKGDRGTGVVIMDNVGEGGDWDLVKLIVGLNAGILMKMEEK